MCGTYRKHVHESVQLAAVVFLYHKSYRLYRYGDRAVVQQRSSLAIGPLIGVHRP